MRLLGTVPARTMRSSAVHFQPGDVLYGRLRPYLNKVYRPDFEGLCSAEFIVLPSSDAVDARYLQYFLNSAPFVGFATHLNTGDRPRIDFEQLRTYPVAVPEIDEQRRIVATIEDQLTRLDAANTSLRSALQRVDHLCDAAVSELGRGCLRRGVGVTMARMAHLSELPALPGGWSWAPLGSTLREPLRNGHSAKKSAGPGGIRTLTLTAVTNGDFSERNTKLTVADANRVSDLWLEPGDLLIERSNAPDLVGTARLYRGRENYSIFPDLIIRARFDNRVVPEYAEAALRSPAARAYFHLRAKGISGSMPKIDQAAIENFHLPLPDPAKQKSLADRLNQVASGAAALKTALEWSRRRSSGLRNSILAAAFTGRLPIEARIGQAVPMEPAHALTGAAQ